jgi:hypothetical protein
LDNRGALALFSSFKRLSDGLLGKSLHFAVVVVVVGVGVLLLSVVVVVVFVALVVMVL